MSNSITTSPLAHSSVRMHKISNFNPRFGDDGDRFRPERWLSTDQVKLQQMGAVQELGFTCGMSIYYYILLYSVKEHPLSHRPSAINSKEVLVLRNGRFTASSGRVLFRAIESDHAVALTFQSKGNHTLS